MINKLRKKFIAIAVISVTIVLFIILGIINITSFVKLNNNANELLSILTENNGVFPKPDKPQDNQHKQMPKSMSPEAPFQTRFFTVTVDSANNIHSVNTGFIAAISTSDAIEYANKAISSGKSTGFYGEYKFSSLKTNDTTLIVFLDCGRDLSTFRLFLFSSILVSSLGILAVFILVLIFSKIVVKPVVDSYERQKRFITDASHEIKTPLAIINASTEVLEMKSGENEWTTSIKNQIERLSTLTCSLISLTRMDEQNNKLLMTDFSLSDAVVETIEPFFMLAKSQNKTLNLNIEKNLTYKGDETSIRQLISIFADNAIKYSNENAQITISLKKQHRTYELTVANTVDCIEKGNLDILFERFYRADTSRSTNTKGYGIGLSIAKATIEQHRGKISAKSVDGTSIEITAIL